MIACGASAARLSADTSKPGPRPEGAGSGEVAGLLQERGCAQGICGPAYRRANGCIPGGGSPSGFSGKKCPAAHRARNGLCAEAGRPWAAGPACLSCLCRLWRQRRLRPWEKQGRFAAGLRERFFRHRRALCGRKRASCAVSFPSRRKRFSALSAKKGKIPRDLPLHVSAWLNLHGPREAALPSAGDIIRLLQ